MVFNSQSTTFEDQPRSSAQLQHQDSFFTKVNIVLKPLMQLFGALRAIAADNCSSGAGCMQNPVRAHFTASRVDLRLNTAAMRRCYVQKAAVAPILRNFTQPGPCGYIPAVPKPAAALQLCSSCCIDQFWYHSRHALASIAPLSRLLHAPCPAYSICTCCCILPPPCCCFSL